ncbi:hypothetical protein Agub_g5760, partial [Astrephomene gubernaculifera]
PHKEGWAGVALWGLYTATFCCLMVPHAAISFLAALLHFLLEVGGYSRLARRLERNSKKHARWMLGSAALSGAPIALALYLLRRPLAALAGALWGFLLTPPLWLAAVQTLVLVALTAGRRTRPLLGFLAPLPLLAALGDTPFWRLGASLIYTAAHLVAPGRLRAAGLSGLAVLSCRSLAWYQALPALLLEFILWLALSVASSASGAAGGGGGGG